MIDSIASIIKHSLQKAPCKIEARYHEPMADHSTFKAGGTADCWMRPDGEGVPTFAQALLAEARSAKIPVFFLGGGANILVSDRGIRGIVFDMGGWAGTTGAYAGNEVVTFRAGTSLDRAAETAADAGLSGLEFLAGMPGTIGGAVWMNARCYGRQISDVLLETAIIKFSGSAQEVLTCPADQTEFGYKQSPFQKMDSLILSAAFKLTPGNKERIFTEMESYRQDRESKGHYRFPSAGSVFKNNPAFGKPAGKIIDELGLRGKQIGGAQVAPWHGNIIINTGTASAADIRALVNEVAAAVKAAAGFDLEPEILFIGHWPSC